MRKRMLALCMALVLFWTAAGAALAETAPGKAAQLTLQDLEALNGGSVNVYRTDKVCFVDGTCTADPVLNQEDAERVAYAMVSLMGGDERTQFEPWRVLNDTAGNTYYVFQQVVEDIVVIGGAAKVITDRDGKMLGLTASVVSDLPEEDGADAQSLTAEEAEALVLKHEEENGNGEPNLVEGLTTKVVLPIDPEIDIEADEVPTRYVWCVYTTNSHAAAAGAELPYLAHYVTLGGEYLYSLPTIVPGDTAGNAGFDASYVFEFMEPAEYTGYVDLADGSEKEITVTLMRDTRTGMYYLGNIEHKIAVADCWNFIYNHGRVVLEYSPDNLEWDQVGLLSLYNYCKAWDYYHEIGWLGGDGEGTPIIVLKDYCDKDHHPVNNAAYAGKFYGWQTFLSSSINQLSQCLDVCAHEFTHCVTGTVMTSNSYRNDYGAINEAMSDIQGNICQHMDGETEDPDWLLGEDVDTVRSMSNPHDYNQPDYVWDIYYKPTVKEPTDANDHGGVHTNSSLLNYVAYLLCTEGDMTLEEARAFWFAVDCSMIPATDYPMMKALLPFVLKISGLDQYQEALAKAIEATRLGETEMPETVDADKALLTLDLPDNETFNNGKWVLSVTSINLETAVEKIQTLLEAIETEQLEGYPGIIQRVAAEIKEHREEEESGKKPGLLESAKNLVTAIFSAAEEPTEEELARRAEEEARIETEMYDLTMWIQDQLNEIYYADLGNAGQDGHTIRMMSRPGRTVPLLMYLSAKPGSDKIEGMKIVVLLMGSWYDLTPLFALDDDGSVNPGQTITSLLGNDLTPELLSLALGGNGWEAILDLVTLDVKGGQTQELPTEGLDKVDLTVTFVPPETENENHNTKSRPKLPEEEPAAEEKTETVTEEAETAAEETVQEPAEAPAEETEAEEEKPAA